MATDAMTIKKQLVTESRISTVNFNDLKFGREFSDHMLLIDYKNGSWQTPQIVPYDSIALSPASSVFHYGQAIFEGLKAHRSEKGDILLFRPIDNLNRMNASARRMCMPEIPQEVFIDGIRELIHVDQQWVPKGEDTSLYIRPFMIADDAFIGVKPSQSYKFMVITSPTSNYYAGAVKVKIETKYTRACEGGIGAAKAAANYAASLYPAKIAQGEGYDQLVWTDAKEHKYIEESGTMNIMFRIDKTLVTPSVDRDTILQGITRNSIISLAKQWGYTVEERRVSVDEIIEALKSDQLREAFGIGTAATIAPISCIGYADQEYKLSDFTQWEFAMKAKNHLENLKRGNLKDDFNWLVKV